MNKAEQRAAAKALFFEGWTQTRIAEAISIAPNTLTKWVVDGEWREERARKHNLLESNSSRILGLIDYQIEALTELTKTYREEKKFVLLDKGEIDALSKLFATIKSRDITWTSYVEVVKEVLRFISLRDPKLAQELTLHTDSFLIQKREELIN